MQSGIGAIMRRFRQVMTVEGNWCDDPGDAAIDEANRRFSALAMLLRKFDVEITSEDNPELSSMITLRPKKPITGRIRPRRSH